MAKTNAPILVIELCDQHDSGWVQEGTERTANPISMTAPQIRFIPNKGFRRVNVPALDRDGKPLVDEDGKPVMTFMNEAIRYIKNQPIISLKEQERLNIRPSHDAINDQIPVKQGRLAVTQEGALTGLYQFLQDVYYNETNTDRVETATKIFRAIKIDEQAEVYIDNEDKIHEAMAFVLTLREAGKQKGQYRYNDTKIDSVCELLGIVAESPATRIKSLQLHAKQYPDLFLSKVRSAEISTITDVNHALELNVIEFNGNSAVYLTKDKVIKSFGMGNIKKDSKIQLLADYFKTADGKEAYDELKAELNLAKENSLQNS